MVVDNGWRIEHVEGRQYAIISHLHHDAIAVKLEAFCRTNGKPDSPLPTTVVWSSRHEVLPPEQPVPADFDPAWLGAPLPFRVHIVWHDEYGERFDTYLDVPSSRRPRSRPDLKATIPEGFATRSGQLAARMIKRTEHVESPQYAQAVPGEVDPRNVFVVVGRNDQANNAMFAFLRALELNPIEWSKAVAATGSGSPYIGQVLDAGFKMAQAVVVLMTPDDVAHLRREYASGDDDPELEPKGQARPNVLFEAGMALGLHPDRTVLVELGPLRPISDVAGRHVVRMNGSPQMRNTLATRLRSAGCAVNTDGSSWYEAGDFTAPKVPSGPTGRRLPSNTTKRSRHLDARYLNRTSGSDRITLQNIGSEDVVDLISPNINDFHGRIKGFPVPKLPVGKSVTLIAMTAGGAPDTWELVVNGKTESGEEFSEPLFLDLNS